jgi:hypothetical protein
LAARFLEVAFFAAVFLVATSFFDDDDRLHIAPRGAVLA